jgi:hypothetical protein
LLPVSLADPARHSGMHCRSCSSACARLEDMMLGQCTRQGILRVLETTLTFHLVLLVHLVGSECSPATRVVAGGKRPSEASAARAAPARAQALVQAFCNLPFVPTESQRCVHRCPSHHQHVDTRPLRANKNPPDNQHTVRRFLWRSPLTRALCA